jgi:hypothetical protein
MRPVMLSSFKPRRSPNQGIHGDDDSLSVPVLVVAYLGAIPKSMRWTDRDRTGKLVSSSSKQHFSKARVEITFQMG